MLMLKVEVTMMIFNDIMIMITDNNDNDNDNVDGNFYHNDDTKKLHTLRKIHDKKKDINI